MLTNYLYQLLETIYNFYDFKKDICYIDRNLLINESKNEKSFIDTNLRRLQYEELIIANSETKNIYSIRITPKGKKELLDTKSCLLVSYGEKEMYKLLKDVCSDNYEVMTKVSVIDIIRNKQNLDRLLVDFAYKSHFDFVISDKQLNPVMVFEYDGNHDEEQHKRDELKDKICELNHIPIVRITGNESINIKTLASKLILQGNEHKIKYNDIILSLIASYRN